EIRGYELREALGIDDEQGVESEADAQAHAQAEWLRNMALWGYPPGWTTQNGRSPQETVRERIQYQFAGDEDDDEFYFYR
ncbi:hypothetical protein MPER_14137, partial [Moniliophthora perniciosa FA553]